MPIAKRHASGAYTPKSSPPAPPSTQPKGSEEEFKDASEAYSVLADSEQRKIYDRTLGVRKVNSSSARWADAAKKTRAQQPLYTAPPPPGMKTHDEAEWKAWHYGVNATQKEAFTQETNWLDLEGNRHQDYFRRQERKEKALYGVGRGQKYNASRQRSDVIERVRLRREARLRRDRAGRSATKKAAEDDVCSIS
eukprot:g16304.t2